MKRSRTVLFVWPSAITATAILAILTVSQPLLGIGLVGGLVAVIGFYRRPRLAFVVWLLSMAFVPPWVGLSIDGFIPVAFLVGVGAAAATLNAACWRPSGGDLVIVGIVVVSGLAVQLDASTKGAWLQMITQWMLSYFVGKALFRACGPGFTGTAFAVVMAIVGGFAIIEFAANWHPFQGLVFNNLSYTTWSPIQLRDGLPRSEWAFGHSIALAASLCLSIPFILQVKARAPLKVLMLLAVLVGIGVTFSRAGLVSTGATLLLGLLLMANIRIRQKVAIVILVIAVSVVTVPFLGTVFTAASAEATESADYRVQLLKLVGTIVPVGRSTAAQVGPDGSVTYAGFGSIDNSLLQIGLGFGWIPVVIGLIPLVVVAVRILIGRRGPADIALVGQIPFFLTVAMITQWQSLVWMVGGFIAATHGAKAAIESSPISSGCRRGGEEIKSTGRKGGVLVVGTCQQLTALEYGSRRHKISNKGSGVAEVDRKSCR